MNEEEKLESQAGPCAEWAAWHVSRAGLRKRLSWLSPVDGVCGSCWFLPLPSCFVWGGSVRNCVTGNPAAAG